MIGASALTLELPEISSETSTVPPSTSGDGETVLKASFAPETGAGRRPLPLDQIRGLRTARDLVDDRRSRLEDDLFATACPPLDGLLKGGLRRGALHELTGWGSSGRFSLVTQTLAAVTQRGEAAALVDLGDGLDPQRAEAAGVVLERLLWVRPRNTKEALASAEVILDAGLPLLILEMGVPPVPGGRGSQAFWLRLARSAQHHRSALLVSSPYRMTGTAAQTVVEAKDRRGRWQGRGQAPRLLDGVRCRLALTKGKGWQGAAPAELELSIAPPPPPVTEKTTDLSEKEKIIAAQKAARRAGEKNAKTPTDLLVPTARSQEQSRGRKGSAKRKAEKPPADPLMTTRRAIA